MKIYGANGPELTFATAAWQRGLSQELNPARQREAASPSPGAGEPLAGRGLEGILWVSGHLPVPPRR